MNCFDGRDEMPRENVMVNKTRGEECVKMVGGMRKEFENLRGFKILSRLYEVAVEVEKEQMRLENECKS